MQWWALAGLGAVGVVAGVSVVVQQMFLATLRSSLGSLPWTVLISYVGGTLTMAAILLVTREPMLTAAAISRSPWWSWAAGAFGVIYIMLAVLLIPRLGAATVLALLVAGQLIASMTFDHFGLFGLEKQPADIQRVAGAALLMAGVLLIRG